MSQYQKGKTNVDFAEARDSEVNGIGISWAIYASLHLAPDRYDNHTNTPPLSFLQAGCLSCRPTNSVKALKMEHNLLQ